MLGRDILVRGTLGRDTLVRDTLVRDTLVRVMLERGTERRPLFWRDRAPERPSLADLGDVGGGTGGGGGGGRSGESARFSCSTASLPSSRGSGVEDDNDSRPLAGETGVFIGLPGVSFDVALYGF